MRPVHYIVARRLFDDSLEPVAITNTLNDALNKIRDLHFSPYSINCTWSVLSVYETPLNCHIVDNKLFFD